MRLYKKIGFILVVFLYWQTAFASDNNGRVNFSVILSGHILLGIGYQHPVQDNGYLNANFYIAPEKGLPYALNGGYGLMTRGERWRGNIGLEAMLIASPPAPDERKYLPLINLLPGIRYVSANGHSGLAQLMVSWFPLQKKAAPTGLELRYGKN